MWLLAQGPMNAAEVHTLSGDLISSLVSPAESQVRKAAQRGKEEGRGVVTCHMRAGVLLHATFSTCVTG